MLHPLNSGCSSHVPACPSSTPSKCCLLSSQAGIDSRLKINFSSASQRCCGLSRNSLPHCAEHALPCWAGPLSPRTQIIYPAKQPQPHPFARCVFILQRVQTKDEDYCSPTPLGALMPTGGRSGGQDLGMEGKWLPGAGVRGGEQLHCLRVR